MNLLILSHLLIINVFYDQGDNQALAEINLIDCIFEPLIGCRRLLFPIKTNFHPK